MPRGKKRGKLEVDSMSKYLEKSATHIVSNQKGLHWEINSIDILKFINLEFKKVTSELKSRCTVNKNRT